MKEKKTIKFNATLWVCEWYGHENETWSKTAKEIVGTIWQEIAEKVFNDTWIYVSAWITDANMVYSKSRWCPEWWEKIAEISGTMNPELYNDIEKWKQAVIDVLTLAKDELKQTTTQVEFTNVDMVYLKWK